PCPRGDPHADGGSAATSNDRLYDREDPDAAVRRIGRGGADDRVDRFTGLQFHQRLHLRPQRRACDLLAGAPRAPLANADSKTHLIRSVPPTMLVMHLTTG